jgi:hypothetical protein
MLETSVLIAAERGRSDLPGFLAAHPVLSDAVVVD